MTSSPENATVGEVGEFGLISRITSGLRKGRHITLGIGDDTGVHEISPGNFVLATVDMMVEGVHFRRDFSSPEEIGWKAFCAGVSDVAAMGGIPTFAMVSLALPADTPVSWVESLYAGMSDLAQICDTAIIGGDTVRSSAGITIDVSIIGETLNDRYITRAGARAGDAILLSGFPGESLAGLKLLTGEIETGNTDFTQLLAAHKRPVPRFTEGIFLGEKECVHSLIDVSDGLSGDLKHICEMSGVGAEIEADAIPISTPLREFCEESSLDPVDLALEGGEDYELLFTVDAESADELIAEWDAISEAPLSRIGVIKSLEDGTSIVRDGVKTSLLTTSFNHFKEGRT